MADLEALRASIRAGTFRGTTAGQCPDRVQANLVVLPASLAPAFRAFCGQNPDACPLLEETSPGAVSATGCAPGADLRSDLPRYLVFRDGEPVAERTEVRDLWRGDLASFLLGCSFSFEAALEAAGIGLRHHEEGKVVPMYVTDRPTVPSDAFGGPLVVSMRPVPEARVEEVRSITAGFGDAHGAPVAVGDPEALGIRDLGRPDYGEAVTLAPGEVPAFWACGVTSQVAARRARPEILITHAPGHMLVTDRRIGTAGGRARGS